jgi:excisionase family DNA binding protein
VTVAGGKYTVTGCYLTVREVTVRYGVKPCTVYEWTRTGGVPYRKLPGRKQLMFSVADLDAFDGGACELERRKVKGGGMVVRPKRAA